MITRDVAQLQVVPAFQHNAKFFGCDAGVEAGTCTCAGGVAAAGSTWFPGFMIDRLGLDQAFNSVLIAPVVWSEIRSSDNAGNQRAIYQAIGVGLQHTSATGGTWADYSTGDWLYEQGLWRQTTATATACGMYTAVQRDVGDVLGGVMTTTTSTSAGNSVSAASSSTGYGYYSGPGAFFSLGGAKRYVRVLIRPRFEQLACGGGLMHVSAAAIFGEPGQAPPSATPSKRILVTSGCAT